MLEHLIAIHKQLGGLDASAVHIAGSKGKGSTAHLLAKLLELSGKKVGLFTSPHILRLSETTQINGCEIDAEFQKKRISEIQEMGENISHFEAMTLLAFEHFNAESCDFAIIECGRGGRGDATNILQEKALCLLTHIEFEHSEFLGDDLEAITKEKLGISKEGAAFIVSIDQSNEVKNVIEAELENVIWAPRFELAHHHPSSLGLALSAAGQLGISISPEMLEALAELKIPGRFEIIKWGIHTLILDGAHTHDSVDFLEKEVNGLP